MSYSRVDGKDTIIFVESEEHKEENVPSTESKDSGESSNAEEGQAAAFDPETGEINWDCPCKYSHYSRYRSVLWNTPCTTLRLGLCGT
jgi:hypothetical protein